MNDVPLNWQKTLVELSRTQPSGKLVLGLNYSGMHDTAVALVATTGQVLAAFSLERQSRVKQDGRPPGPLLDGMPWDQIVEVAVSTDEHPWAPADPASVLHPTPLRLARNSLSGHGQEFYDLLATLAPPKTFVCHQMSHAGSAFWLSGFDEALCLTYDGGMWNSPWFGGLFRANPAEGIVPLDRFSASHYAKITSLYSVITAVLGFAPNKHEGKVTGLAAYGAPTPRCRRILDQLFESEFLATESLVEWVNVYSADVSPTLVVNPGVRDDLRLRLGEISPQELAATLQQMTEDHVLRILETARDRGWIAEKLCVAGGLFANVTLNRRLKASGFSTLFVSPPMTDDGAAVGAALVRAATYPEFRSTQARDVYWGVDFAESEIEKALDEHRLSYRREADPTPILVAALRAGESVGLFQGRMEFGPRSLGNRSILNQATDPKINQLLNARLRRTDFMPFAPVSRLEDSPGYYEDLDGVEQSAEFMTITCSCTDRMKAETPAVVHVDGTARPQVLRREVNPFLHDLLTAYKAATGLSALINTSFNIHEEPIVCSPTDAIRGFLEAGLDVLYFEGGYVVTLEANTQAASEYLRRRLGKRTQAELQLESLSEYLHRELLKKNHELEDKQEWAASLLKIAEERLAAIVERDCQLQDTREWALELGAAADVRLRELREKETALQDKHRWALELLRIAEERLVSLNEKEAVIRSISAELDRITKSAKPEEA